MTCVAAVMAPQVADAYQIDGTHYNSGTWRDSLYITSTGSFINLSGGVLESSLVMNTGRLENRLGGVINNYTRLLHSTGYTAVLYNYGEINNFAGSDTKNYGPWTNYAGATLSNLSGATMLNLGTLSNAGSFINAGQFEQRYENVTGAPARKLVNSGTLTNSGTMSVASRTALENTGSFVNSGTFNDTTKTLTSSGTWTNSGALNVTGTISSDMSGAASFTNRGALTNTGSVTNVNGTIQNYGSWVNDATITNTTSNYIGEWGRFTNYGGADLVNHGSLVTNHVVDNAGTVTNTGTLSASYQFKNQASGTVTNEAGGQLNGNTYNYGVLDNHGQMQSVFNHGVLNNHAGATLIDRTLDNYGTFTNDVGASVRGYGSLTNASGATLVNRGDLDHWSSDLYPNWTSNAGTLLNAGRLANRRTLFNSGSVLNEGSIVGTGTYTQTTGTTTNAASLTQSAINIQGGQFIQRSGSVNAGSFANAGTLRGSGTLDVATLTNAGVVAPGESTPGALTIAGDFVQTAPGLLSIDLGGLQPGVQYEFLSATGTAALSGTLLVDLWFEPAIGARFDVVHADGGISGTFETLALPTLSAERAWAVDYTGTDVWLRVVDNTPPPIPEPGSFVLMGLGLAGLAASRRTRQTLRPQ